MADTQTNGHDALEETLSRLSKKPGVKATIVLDRATGSILKTSGQVSTLRTAKTPQPPSTMPTQPPGAPFSGDPSASQPGEPQGAEDFAAKVWAFVNASGTLVQDLDTEDELKLLRLRTRKQELVIVPDAKWLLIVIHDTPPA